MVTKQQLDESLNQMRKDLTETINESIKGLQEHIIDNLVKANKELQDKVDKLEMELQASLQYNRLNNIIISGIPGAVDHKDLKGISLGVLNSCLDEPITARAFEGCHRVSSKSEDVVCRLVNRGDVEDALDNRNKLQTINKTAVGLPRGTGQIYLNTHLTPYNSKLAYFCRQLKKKKKVSKINIRKGKIKILISDQDEEETDAMS